jgi:hypothetical protein
MNAETRHYHRTRNGRTIEIIARNDRRRAFKSGRFLEGENAYEFLDTLDAMILSLEQVADDLGAPSASTTLTLPSGRRLWLMGISPSCNGQSLACGYDDSKQQANHER